MIAIIPSSCEPEIEGTILPDPRFLDRYLDEVDRDLVDWDYAWKNYGNCAVAVRYWSDGIDDHLGLLNLNDHTEGEIGGVIVGGYCGYFKIIDPYILSLT